MASYLRTGLLCDGADDDRRPAARHGPVRHGEDRGHPPAGRPDGRGRAGQPEDGAGAPADLRPDAGPQVGDLDGCLRIQRRHVQQLRHRAGRRPHRAGRHLPSRLPAATGDAARLHRQAARQDPEHEARSEPRAPDHRAGGGRATAAAAGGRAQPRPPGRAAAGVAGMSESESNQQPAVPDPAELAGRERLTEPVVRTGMFGATGTGDTSGYGGLQVRRPPRVASPRPYGSYFDEIADRLADALGAAGTSFSTAVEQVVVASGDLTFYVRREHLPAVAARLRDDPQLRFELCLGVSGVHYPTDPDAELHAVYHLLSITHNRRLRVEVTAPDADPHIPSLTSVYPTCDFHERETWDFFGVIFDGHPALTRIEMPDDWRGHPQRKDYPLGGIPVEYRGATIPPPDERRSYE